MGTSSTDDDSGHDSSRGLDSQQSHHNQQPNTFSEIFKKWPKSTFLIIGNEFCERFSFYGMRAVLILYLINILKFENSHSTVLFHAFTMVSYTSPLLGSILADGYFGKFWTIFSISIVYAIGQIILASSSLAPAESSLHPWVDLIGLFVIAIGTGGIKPCVSAFGGDQFPASWTRMISIFFSIFYFSINAGSLLSMIITPYMRAMSCLGNESCYPLAFGIPAVLMIAATIVFMSGSFWYKKVPPKENVIARVCKTILRALRNKYSSSPYSKDRDHWLEYSLDGHRCELSDRCRHLHGNCAERKFIDDVKIFVRVCVMMIPVPMFWALYDQQGSTWVLQATSMNAHVTSGWTVLPEQMGVINALLILFMIPMFQWIVYPGIEKLGFEMTMLRKMAGGGILTAVAFFICGIVQLFVNTSLATLPTSTESHIYFINTFPSCHFEVQIGDGQSFQLPAGMNTSSTPLQPQIFHHNNFHPNISFTSPAPNCPNFQARPLLSAGHAHRFTVSPNGWTFVDTSLTKPSTGQGVFSLAVDLQIPCDRIPDEVTWKGCNQSSEGYTGIIGVCRMDESTDEKRPCEATTSRRTYHLTSTRPLQINSYKDPADSSSITGTSYLPVDIDSGTYRFYYIEGGASSNIHPIDVPSLEQPEMGGVYVANLVTRSRMQPEMLSKIDTLVNHNHISIMWQIPQYVLLTAGEVMFSVTGLEFAYKEAAPELKSVVQAIWLLTTAVGDLIDVAILSMNLFTDVAVQMFVFGGLMIIVIIIFILLSVFYYKYADYSDQSENETEISSSETGKSSLKVL